SPRPFRCSFPPRPRTTTTQQIKESSALLRDSGRIRPDGRVLAPNGQDSTLFQTLLEETGNRAEALRLYAMTHTPFFKRWFGDWEGLAHQDRFILLCVRISEFRTIGSSLSLMFSGNACYRC